MLLVYICTQGWYLILIESLDAEEARKGGAMAMAANVSRNDAKLVAKNKKQDEVADDEEDEQEEQEEK